MDMEKPPRWSIRCVDAGSEYCPCHLAESGNCIACSLLSGAEFCHCSWSGSCIYLNYYFSQGVIAERSEEIVAFEKNEIAPGLIEIYINLGLRWLQGLSQIGAFLFIRPKEAPNYAAVPVSIANVNGSRIRLVVQSTGPKTRLLSKAKGKIAIRGPYYSSLSDSYAIKRTRNSKILLVAGGVGQSALVLAAKALLRQENQLWACLAPGSAGLIYVSQDLEALGVTVEKVPSMRPYGITMIKDWLVQLQPSLIIVAGPEGLQTAVQEMIDNLDNKGYQTKFVRTQNAVMCCGDGLCGSCLSNEFGQERIPLCKAQYCL